MVLDGKIEEPIMIRGEKIEEENNFTYLGVSMKPEPSSGAEVAIRIAKAVKVFRASYHPLWKRRQVSVETKIGRRCYQCCCMAPRCGYCLSRRAQD